MLVLGSLQTNAYETISARVTKISDGDTITVLSKGKGEVKIRLAGIDCPERGQPWGKKATEALRDQLKEGKNVHIQVVDVDRYGRLVGKVYTNGININRFMVRTGNCWVYPRYAKDQRLFELQQVAQEKKQGLWSLDESQRIPPWKWRQQNR